MLFLKAVEQPQSVESIEHVDVYEDVSDYDFMSITIIYV